MRVLFVVVSVLFLMGLTLQNVTTDATVSGGNLVSDASSGSAGSGDPVLYFSDLISGPDTGLGDGSGTGTLVTVWGTGLGTSQGSSTIEFCDSTATCRDASHVYYWQSADGTAGPADLAGSHGLQEIAFSLPDGADGAGTIKVTVDSTESNTLPFTVRSGNIYWVDDAADASSAGTFADPLAPDEAFDSVTAGDIYYFRGGTYDSKYDDGHANWYVSDHTAGTSANPVAVVGYSSEKPFVDSYSTFNLGALDQCMLVPDYWHVSKFEMECGSLAIAIRDGGRAVGNKTQGNTVVHDGANVGIIDMYDNSAVAYGNEVWGILTGSQQSHAIYVKGCADTDGTEVAYNYVYDSDNDRGPYVVINHQDPRCATNQAVQQHKIYSNVVDCSAHRSRGIGVYELSWDSGVDTAGPPEYALVYNNIVKDCGVTVYPAMYTNAGYTKWFNNYVTGAVGKGLEISGTRVEDTVVQNNIFEMNSSSYDYIDHQDGTLTASHNAFYGGDATSVTGTNNVTSDVQFNLNTTNATVTLSTGSSAIGAGTQVSEVTEDFWKNASTNPPNIGPTQETQ